MLVNFWYTESQLIDYICDVIEHLFYEGKNTSVTVGLCQRYLKASQNR